MIPLIFSLSFRCFLLLPSFHTYVTLIAYLKMWGAIFIRLALQFSAVDLVQIGRTLNPNNFQKIVIANFWSPFLTRSSDLNFFEVEEEENEKYFPTDRISKVALREYRVKIVSKKKKKCRMYTYFRRNYATKYASEKFLNVAGRRKMDEFFIPRGS